MVAILLKMAIFVKEHEFCAALTRINFLFTLHRLIENNASEAKCVYEDVHTFLFSSYYYILLYQYVAGNCYVSKRHVVGSPTSTECHINNLHVSKQS